MIEPSDKRGVGVVRALSDTERARNHLRAIRDFAYHLMVFVFVNGLLVILDVRAGRGETTVLGLDWAYWVLLFWGIGLAGHAISVFLGDDRIEDRSEGTQSTDLIDH
jgi:hypothetical protein